MAERFASESLQAARLSHPHILPVYDAGEADGVSYVAMQWVDGATLEQLVAEGGPIEVERAVGLTEAIADALDHAHDQGLVHRDVKPANVMVDAEGHPYLMDFGLNAERAVDRRADVQGLAGLAFRCLTGHAPSERDEPPLAHEIRPAVPPAASETIRRALARRPEERPATAGAFAAQLRAALGDAPADTVHLAAIPADMGEADVAAPARRSRRLVAAAAATVLAAFGGMSLAGVTGGGTPSGEIPAAGAGDGAERERTTTQDTAPAETTATEPAPQG